MLISAATFVTCFRLDIENAAAAALAGQILTALLLMLMVVILCAEPLAPSRLVRARWERTGAGPFTRMLGPGLLRGIGVQIALGTILLAACYAGGVMASAPGGLRDKIGIASTGSARASTPGALAIVAAYTLMFDVFLLGVAAFLRTRKRGGDNVAVARAWTIALAVVAAIVPWIVATILSSLMHDERTAALFASPSPFFAIYAFNQELYRSGDPFHYTVAALSAALVWGAIGLVFLGIAWERGRRSVQVALKVAKQTEKKLDQEADEEWDEDDDEIDAVLHPPAPPPPPRTSAGGSAESTLDAAAKVEGSDERPKGAS